MKAIKSLPVEFNPVTVIKNGHHLFIHSLSKGWNTCLERC